MSHCWKENTREIVGQHALIKGTLTGLYSRFVHLRQVTALLSTNTLLLILFNTPFELLITLKYCTYPYKYPLKRLILM